MREGHHMKLNLFYTILACTTLTSLAYQSTKTELLTHLKSIKTEIEAHLKESKTTEQDSPEGLFLLNITNEFFNEAQDLQKLLITEHVKPQFDLICNQMNTLDQLPEVNYKPVTYYDYNGEATGISYIPAIIVDMSADLKNTQIQP